MAPEMGCLYTSSDDDWDVDKTKDAEKNDFTCCLKWRIFSFDVVFPVLKVVSTQRRFTVQLK